MLRFLTAGESHGPALTAVIEGLPAGIPLNRRVIDEHLRRRQSSYGRGGRMRIERDEVEILSGVRKGLTLGSPVALLIRNRDWENWYDVMSADAGDINLEREAGRLVARPRPGHADLPGALKYRYRDLRNVLERASARETAARVAVGSVARALLEQLGCTIFGHVVQIGTVVCGSKEAGQEEYRMIAELARSSPVGCADPERADEMMREIERARDAGDTLGGVFEVICLGLPPGLGSHVHWDRRLDTRLAAVLMSIPSVKGVEIGLGFRGAGLRGSAFHDAIFYGEGRGFYRPTNHAGGIEGGMTNGEPLVIRAAVKPLPTLIRPLHSVDLFTKEEADATIERSDVCVVPAAAVVAEAVTAWVLADAVLEKFGNDTMEEIRSRWREYQDYLEKV